MLTFGNVHCELDFNTKGKYTGFLDMSHSDNDLAFSVVRTPVGVINGNDGPTLLLTAGNHGDEYEGQIILHRLMNSIEPQHISGRIIMLPALNSPAVLGRGRVSPLDQANMNRSFPGNKRGGPTQNIAGFVNEFLIPMADTIIDFHSGGTSAEYTNCGFHCRGANSALNHQNFELVEMFGAPFSIVMDIDNQTDFIGDFDTAAYQQETPFISCELGGMGRLSGESLKIGWQGCLRILKMMGFITAKEVSSLQGTNKGETTRFIKLGRESQYITSSTHGIAELHLELGMSIHRGTEAARVFDLYSFGKQPETLHVPCDGIVTARRRNPIVMPGDHLFFICPELERESLIDR